MYKIKKNDLWGYAVLVFLAGYMYGQEKIMTDLRKAFEVDHG